MDQIATKRIGHDGLTITGQKNGIYTGVYFPTHPPYCSCGCVGAKNGKSDTKTVTDLITGEEDEPEIIQIEVKIERFTCPSCSSATGHSVKIPYDPQFCTKGSQSTRRFDNYVGQLCLNNSPERVCEIIGNTKSETWIRNTFSAWADEHLHDYREKLIAPDSMGCHMIQVGKNRYIVITDLVDNTILDIFQPNNAMELYWLLLQIQHDNRPNAVVSDIYPDCLVPVRGTVNAFTMIRASKLSLYREYTNALSDAIESLNIAKGKKELKEWVLIPPYDDNSVISPKARYMRTAIYTRMHGPGEWLDSMNDLRFRVYPAWTRDEYERWKQSAPQHSEFSCFNKLLEIASNEIRQSFSNSSLQEQYCTVERKLLDLIAANQKCAFETMRARLLLSFKPQLYKLREKGVMKYYYSGISLDRLLTDLPEYQV